MAVVKRNGKSYGEADVQVAMLGSLSWEVTALEYGVEQDHSLNYSFGSNKGTSWSSGKITPKASITIRLASASAIEKAAGGNLLSIKPFTINATYVNEYNDIINDTLTVKFKSQGRNVSGDDIKQQFDLFAIDIDFNNV